jgi:hypothetical protein
MSGMQSFLTAQWAATIVADPRFTACRTWQGLRDLAISMGMTTVIMPRRGTEPQETTSVGRDSWRSALISLREARITDEGEEAALAALRECIFKAAEEAGDEEKISVTRVMDAFYATYPLYERFSREFLYEVVRTNIGWKGAQPGDDAGAS